MRLEFESNVSALPVSETVEGVEQSERNPGKAKEMLHEGIKAAQAGNRSQARHLLLSVTELDPQNENAWLWLASISEYPEELLVFLKNVLDINPDNQRAQQWTRSTKSLLAKTFVQRGIEASSDGQKDFANQCFNQAIAQDEENGLAWLWLASVCDDHEEKLAYLNKVLVLDPENEDARGAVDAVWQKFAESYLEAAYSAAAQGDKSRANHLLDELLEKLPETAEAWLLKSDLTEDLSQKSALLDKVLSLDPNNEEALSSLEAIRQETLRQNLEGAHSAAREDRPEDALALLEVVLSASPELEEAWELKAQLAQDQVEKVVLFEKLLSLNPANEVALSGLEAVRQENVKKKLQSANGAAFEGRRDKALELLAEILHESPEMEEAWMLKSHLAESFDEKIEAFEKVLDLNPDNMGARSSLESLQAIMKSLEPNVSFESSESTVEEPVVKEAAPAAHFEHGDDRNPTQELELPEGLHESSPFEGEPVPENETYTKFDSAEGELPADYTFAEDPWPTEENLDEVAEIIEELYPSTEGPENESGHDPYSYESNKTDEPVRFEENTTAYYEETVAETAAESFTNEISPEIPEGDFADTTTKDWSVQAGSESTDSSTAYSEPVWESVSSPVQAADTDYEAPAYERVQSDPFAETVAFSTASLFEKEEHAVAEQSGHDSDMAYQEEFVPSAQPEASKCPFCEAENANHVYVCGACNAMLTLADLEMLLAHSGANREALGFAVERMEAEGNARELNESELVDLGIGHINLKNFIEGLAYLQKANQLNPNDVVLSGQINALSIRLAEIREQTEAHDSMVKGKSILVVDDSATVRKLIAGKLEKSGHDVVCAVDGVDALQKLEDMVPDLVLLDINMPRMDGYQVCKMIRNNPATENIPVVMISGKDGFFDKVRGRMSGTTGYITKPFGPETLMKALETYIVSDPVHESVEE